ncbi:N-acetylmuramoyl-L-alanine amidase [Streptomyces katsurahamanus]|uniref:N-acetylmuramoyl-L-alanine amidase n=1 Tax=Streptomyces katsurahamanus TaxID=2577098 RepID=A0ABW9NMA5_9ACTN|nr:N-acetylmuramoyl-L-alanine amidase [Streptomyces katsurahamanus]MQS34455.1 N-acetylmuramoyl-L-alanine amidase [Streptomyces katsurahamanus]
MRGFLASSVQVAVSTALVLPLSLPSGAAAAPPPADRAPDLPGSTQSLPLAPSARSLAPSAEHRLSAPRVRPFSLVGVVWDDAGTELHGTVQVRTRAVGSGRWSGWRKVETHNHDHGADPGTPERRASRGSTAPLWAGASDGVEARVRPDTGEPARLPAGMRLELVHPGEDETAETRALSSPYAETRAHSSLAAGTRAISGPGTDTGPRPHPSPAAGPRPLAGPPGALPFPETLADVLPAAPATLPYVGPRPRIVTRKGWGASESLREKGFVYSAKVKAAFVHHSATGNGYTCKQAPSVLRSIYRYHVVSTGWRDIGYNFAVDKCGNIYEGRAGGVAKAVRGAHTLGFNTNSMGIAVLGSYSRTDPPAAAVTALAKLTAWKLGLFQGNPKGRVTLTSGGSGKYAKGRKVTFNVISGHRDGFHTDCPGARLYGRLGAARTASAGYQGRV